MCICQMEEMLVVDRPVWGKADVLANAHQAGLFM